MAIAGDITQRARHGEFQRALVFVQALRRLAPTLIVPGNHDVQWWATPFDVIGAGPKYEKYRRYFGDDLTPTLVHRWRDPLRRAHQLRRGGRIDDAEPQ